MTISHPSKISSNSEGMTALCNNNDMKMKYCPSFLISYYRSKCIALLLNRELDIHIALLPSVREQSEVLLFGEYRMDYFRAVTSVGAARSCSELLGAARGCSEQLGAARSCSWRSERIVCTDNEQKTALKSFF